MGTSNPLVDFTTDLIDFARGDRRGIRNPFVMVPVEPAIERRVSTILDAWAAQRGGERLAAWDNAVDTDGLPVTVTAVRLDALLPETTAFQTSTDLGPLERVDTESVQGTLQRNLASELIEQVIDETLRANDLANEQRSVLLLLNLGCVYPFSRASELLDELDRRNVKTTVGIPFPGSVIGGRLSFFNEDARHYYPAHRIDQQITEGFLTDV
jgi:hypothetical protein